MGQSNLGIGMTRAREKLILTSSATSPITNHLRRHHMIYFSADFSLELD